MVPDDVTEPLSLEPSSRSLKEEYSWAVQDLRYPGTRSPDDERAHVLHATLPIAGVMAEGCVCDAEVMTRSSVVLTRGFLLTKQLERSVRLFYYSERRLLDEL